MKDKTIVVGSGDIASALKGVVREGTIFFASGVSNSQETDEKQYKREIDLLLSQDKSKHLVYFGSLCIFYSKTRYARHKLWVETLVKKHFRQYTIIRLGNINWGKNPHTLINYFKNQKKEGNPLQIRDESRYICMKDEFIYWINIIPTFNCEMNISGRKMTIQEIVDEFV